MGTFLLLELALQLLPAPQALERQSVNESNPYLHYRPNREVTYSAGWNFAISRRVRINNFGFVNDQDYDPHAQAPLLAVIGDSYVEALQVRYPSTLHGRLAQAIGPRGRVYSFAMSGAPLTQYLAYAQFARDRFRPDALVIVVIGNDFDESLLEYAAYPGMHHLKRSEDGDYGLHLVPFEPSWSFRAVRKSALAQYLTNNLRAPGIFSSIRARLSPDPHVFVGNVSAEAGAERIRASQAAVDYFLERLPQYAGVAPDRIVLVVDGLRTQLYDREELRKVQASYVALMRAYFIARGLEHGYHVADMQPRFIERHARDGARFEWGFDHHWNDTAHEEAARAVVASGVLQHLWTFSPE